MISIFILPAVARIAQSLGGKIIYTQFPAVNKDPLEEVSGEYFQRNEVFLGVVLLS